MAGEYPEAAKLIRAAKYLGCTPWELKDQPMGWHDLALTLQEIEQEQQQENE